MASNVPIVKQVALFSLIPQLLVMGIIILLFYYAGIKDFLLYGAAAYVILAYALRNLVAKSHRQGIKFVKQHQLQDAIPLFEKSVVFFTKNSWVDKYRSLTLLSSSKMTYKEMGLCNIAFCYSQMGDGRQAKSYYEQTLLEFPNNGLAIAGLNMITAIEKQALTSE